MSTFISHLLKRSCVIVGGSVAPLALAAGGASAADCGKLAGKTFGAAQVTAATSVSPPSSLVNIDFPMGPVAITTPFCRVQGVIKPSADSDIRFEVWLPTESAWNGKYQGVGNGGFAGSLLYISMARALEGGYAVSATDTGHSGGALEAAWALGHPEKIADFGWRGIHEAASVSKGIVQAYYGKAPSHAYFSGCSDGGREALMEAQRFPEDYDGIVAGAPRIIGRDCYPTGFGPSRPSPGQRAGFHPTRSQSSARACSRPVTGRVAISTTRANAISIHRAWSARRGRRTGVCRNRKQQRCGSFIPAPRTQRDTRYFQATRLAEKPTPAGGCCG